MNLAKENGQPGPVDLSKVDAGLAFRIYLIWYDIVPASRRCSMDVSISRSPPAGPYNLITLQAALKSSGGGSSDQVTTWTYDVTTTELLSAPDVDDKIRFSLLMACVNLRAKTTEADHEPD